MNRRLLITSSSIVIVLGIAAAVVLRATLFHTHLPPVERGRRIAEREGCFACHGPGGLGGVPNAGRREGNVPGFAGHDEDPDETQDGGHVSDADHDHASHEDTEVRQWIRDGVPEDRANSKQWQAERDAGAISMPAFGDKLTDLEIDDLVAFVKAAGGARSLATPLQEKGYDRARELGCFGCHGPGGRFSPPNPGSLKGYIPSWDGEDFPELVRDREEFDQWVTKGISDRFDKSPFARVYLDRATIHMPAFERHLQPGDLDAMWAYVEWLQSREH